MTKINQNELKKIEGGLSLSAALLESIRKLTSTLLDAGRYLGGAIRRLTSNQLCSCR